MNPLLILNLIKKDGVWKTTGHGTNYTFQTKEQLLSLIDDLEKAKQHILKILK